MCAYDWDVFYYVRMEGWNFEMMWGTKYICRELLTSGPFAGWINLVNSTALSVLHNQAVERK